MRTNQNNKKQSICLILKACLLCCLLFQVQLQSLAKPENLERDFRRLVNFKSLEKDLLESKIIVLQLSSVLIMALEKNLDLQVEAYNQKESQYELFRSTTEFLPSLNLVSAFTRNKGNIQFTGDNLLAIENESYTGGANFSFDLFRGGKVLFGWLASQKELEAAKKNLNTKEQEILSQATISYFRLQSYLAQVESELVRIEEAQRNLTERKIALEVGTDIRLNVLLAEQELQSAKASLANLRGQFYTESVNLAKLLNLRLGTILVPFKINNQKLLKFDQKETQYRASKLIQLALTNNPQISALELNYQGIELDRKAVFGDLLPTLTAQANFGYIGPELNNIKENNQYSLSVNYDLANLGGKKLADSLQATNFRKKTQTELAQKTLEIGSQALGLFFQFVSREAAYLANQKALKVSEKAYEQADARLRAGLSTPYELKVAQNDLETTRSKYYSSLIDFKISEVDLLKTIGLVNIKNLTEGIEI